MFLKTKISEIFNNLQTRYFNTTSMSGRATKLVQFHSGGDDYCPTKECEGLGECIGGNPADGIVIAWRDDVLRKSQEGEKRIYSVLLDPETGKAQRNGETGEILVASEIHLKNDGSVVVSGGKDLNIVVLGNANLSVEKALNIKAKTISSSGAWVHSGNLSASHIEALDGMDGVLDKPSFTKGIATGGS